MVVTSNTSNSGGGRTGFSIFAGLEGGDVRTRLACRAEAMDEVRYKSLVPRLEDEPVYLGWGKQHKRTILYGFSEEESPQLVNFRMWCGLSGFHLSPNFLFSPWAPVVVKTK